MTRKSRLRAASYRRKLHPERDLLKYPAPEWIAALLIAKKKNRTQAAIAKAAGVKQSTVSEWLSNKYAPELLTVKALCDGLGVRMDKFFQPGCEEVEKRRKQLAEERREAEAAALESCHDAKVFADALGKLDPDQRRLVWRMVEENLSSEEMADGVVEARHQAMGRSTRREE